MKSTSTVILKSRLKSQCHKMCNVYTIQLTINIVARSNWCLTMATKMSLGHCDAATVQLIHTFQYRVNNFIPNICTSPCNLSIYISTVWLWFRYGTVFGIRTKSFIIYHHKSCDRHTMNVNWNNKCTSTMIIKVQVKETVKSDDEEKSECIHTFWGLKRHFWPVLQHFQHVAIVILLRRTLYLIYVAHSIVRPQKSIPALNSMRCNELQTTTCYMIPCSDLWWTFLSNEHTHLHDNVELTKKQRKSHFTQCFVVIFHLFNFFSPHTENYYKCSNYKK